MRVLFISDFGLTHTYGGAQRSNAIIIEEGKRRGHEIKEVYCDTEEEVGGDWDLVITSNFQEILKYKKEWAEFAIQHPNHVRLEHDMSTYMEEGMRKRLYDSTRISFFLSDYHLESFKEVYGLKFKNPKIVYDPIDPSLFNVGEQEKTLDIIYCGLLHPLKGVFNMFDFATANPHRSITLFGWAEDARILNHIKKTPNIRYHGRLKHEDVPIAYASAQYVYHDPMVREPFCRMVAESLMSGLSLEGSRGERIGAYKEYCKVGREEFIEKCANAHKEFWEIIEND